MNIDVGPTLSSIYTILNYVQFGLLLSILVG